MTASPRVSVCIVTYNHERYIYECIMSVLAQMRDVPLEILVGDDVSDDSTSPIVRDLASRYPDAIRYYRHEIRLGPLGNYQFLIQRAKGEYIAHLDGDDYWLPGKLKAQTKRLDDEPDCSAVYSNALCINDEGCLLGLFNNPQPDRFNFAELLKRGNFLNHSSMLYRVFFQNEILSWEPDFIDYRIHLYLAKYGQIAYLNSPFVGYRINSTGSMIVYQNDKVRLLYWSALLDALSGQEDQNFYRLAIADFLSGIFFRARETNSANFFFKWWKIVIVEYQGNVAWLAVMVAIVTIRRRFRSLLTKYCGKLAALPLHIFHRR